MQARPTFAVVLFLCSLVLGACGTRLPDHSVFLGQTVREATAEEVAIGFSDGPDSIRPPKEMLSACGGAANGEMRFVVVRMFHYWHNRQSVHTGLYWAIADKFCDVPPETTVEVELLVGKSGARCPTIRALRTASVCAFRNNGESAASKAATVFTGWAGYGSASLYCPELESEGGWTKSILGPYGAFAWMKAPEAPASAAVAERSQPASPGECKPRPPPIKPQPVPDYVSCMVKGEPRAFVPRPECDP